MTSTVPPATFRITGLTGNASAASSRKDLPLQTEHTETFPTLKEDSPPDIVSQSQGMEPKKGKSLIGGIFNLIGLAVLAKHMYQAWQRQIAAEKASAAK